MSDSLEIVRTVADLRRRVSQWRGESAKIALVPTMGALHAGHVSLVELARRHAKRVVVSIFVNPTQFAANEDLSRYPRDEVGDLRKLASAGADLVWSPSVVEMYPDGFSTGVMPGSAAADLEGKFRPTHFAGVTTVCCKLFNQVTPDFAIFGEKDFQQLAVLRQMVRDLDMPLKLIAAPTMREADGLAMSSRNAYLSAEERKIAPNLNAEILKVAAAIQRSGDPKTATEFAIGALTALGFKIDYLEVRDAETLQMPDKDRNRALRVLVAAWLGKTRLIDNVAV